MSVTPSCWKSFDSGDCVGIPMNATEYLGLNSYMSYCPSNMSFDQSFQSLFTIILVSIFPFAFAFALSICLPWTDSRYVRFMRRCAVIVDIPLGLKWQHNRESMENGPLMEYNKPNPIQHYKQKKDLIVRTPAGGITSIMFILTMGFVLWMAISFRFETMTRPQLSPFTSSSVARMEYSDFESNTLFHIQASFDVYGTPDNLNCDDLCDSIELHGWSHGKGVENLTCITYVPAANLYKCIAEWNTPVFSPHVSNFSYGYDPVYTKKLGQGVMVTIQSVLLYDGSKGKPVKSEWKSLARSYSIKRLWQSATNCRDYSYNDGATPQLTGVLRRVHLRSNDAVEGVNNMYPPDIFAQGIVFEEQLREPDINDKSLLVLVHLKPDSIAWMSVTEFSVFQLIVYSLSLIGSGFALFPYLRAASLWISAKFPSRTSHKIVVYMVLMLALAGFMVMAGISAFPSDDALSSSTQTYEALAVTIILLTIVCGFFVLILCHFWYVYQYRHALSP